MNDLIASRSLPLAPAALHAGNGRPADYGRYQGAIADPATAAWDGGRGLFSPRRLQRKGWMYFGAFSERCMLGFAIVDAGLMATAFVYVYDRERRVLVEEKLTLPLGFAAGFAPRIDVPWQLQRGARRWAITPQAQGWRLEHESPRLQLRADFRSGAPGMTAIASSPGRPFHHTYKVCTLPAQLRIALDGQAFETAARGTLDFTLGYPPRHTQWNWASLDGVTDDGQRVGVNLVAHFMNGLENALWLGDALLPVAQAVFQYDPARRLEPWRIRSEEGLIDIVFEPEGERREDLSIGLLASVFTQPFGRFTGTLCTPQGPRRVSGFGVVEQHRAVW